MEWCDGKWSDFMRAYAIAIKGELKTTLLYKLVAYSYGRFLGTMLRYFLYKKLFLYSYKILNSKNVLFLNFENGAIINW